MRINFRELSQRFRIVIVSVGEDNRFGHPSPEVLERYAAHGLTVLLTDERGTIEFSTDKERLWVETARLEAMEDWKPGILPSTSNLPKSSKSCLTDSLLRFRR
jgi:hypothetical protein